MNEIRGDAKSIRSLLGGSKFGIDYYQREYRWQSKQVTELLDDLAAKFLDSYEEGDDRRAVSGYGRYFLGSIIISDKDGQKFIIDGQQRLTSLTLLLVHLYRRLADKDDRAQLAGLIFSQRYGDRSYNLDVEERKGCMDALFLGTPYDEENKPESVVTMLARYQDIEESVSDEVAGPALPYFVDWLIENVYLVEITAYSDADAYTIFETMNDRGLSLTPTDMLKGYLLANIRDPDHRTEASEVWKARVAALQRVGKEEDADAIKAWLRSQHADSIRERKRNAIPRDFDLIGTEFHRWVKDREESLGLENDAGFREFIQTHFKFYSIWYERIRQAAENLTPGLEAIHFNAQNKFTLQYPTLLAPLRPTDSEAVINRKLRIVAGYIDILIARRVWNWKSTDYSTMQYAMFQLVILKIRGMEVEQLAQFLIERLTAEEQSFQTNDRFRLHGMNGRQIHRMLARMTDYVGVQSGLPSRYGEYIHRRGKDGYEVEHILANHHEHHLEQFPQAEDFSEYRNRLGGLLLLPKSFNASYGDMPFDQKLPHYYGQNPLAQSLHPTAYKHNPGFRRFIERSGLPFRPHEDFDKDDIQLRQELYRRIAELIWSPEVLEREATPT